MKKYLVVILGLCLTGLVATAAEGEKKGDAKSTRSKILQQYDKNGDGKLDESEREAMRKDRESEMLKKYDKNGDGKLDEAERAAAREDMKKRREGAGKGGQKQEQK